MGLGRGGGVCMGGKGAMHFCTVNKSILFFLASPLIIIPT